MNTLTVINSVLFLAILGGILAGEHEESRFPPPAVGGTATAGKRESTRTPPPTLIYFGTLDGGIKSYSLPTATATTVVGSNENLQAVAYDSINNQIYYCSQNQIYRANVDGSEVQAMRSNIYFVGLYDVACDWVTGNLYVVSSTNLGGSVYVCTASSSVSLVCATIVRSEWSFYGIAVDTFRGGIFIGGSHGIHRANIDGTDFESIIMGYSIAGITVDPYSDRLYWASYSHDRIGSSFRNGSGVETIVQLDNDAQPWGVTKVSDLIYWGDYNGRKIQSSTTAGEYVVTVYNGTSHVEHLALVPSQDEYLDRFRTENSANPCEGQGCWHMAKH